MEGLLDVTSTVPGLEHEAGRQGTAMAHFIGAANYWHGEAERRQNIINGFQVQRRVRVLTLIALFAAGLVSGGGLHYLGLW